MAIKIAGSSLAAAAAWGLGALVVVGVAALIAKKVYPIASVKIAEATHYFLTIFEEPVKEAPLPSSSNYNHVKKLPTISGYKTVKLLHEGSLSNVYYLKRNTDGVKFICKSILKGATSSKQLLREIHISKKLKHPNIVNVEEVIESKNTTKLLMKYVSKSIDLSYFMRKGSLDKELVMKILGQIVMALKHCHNQNIIHRDLKLENILIEKHTHHIKLIDFGLSRYIPKDGSAVSTECGTLSSSSPELLSGKPYDGIKNDIWGLGVILYIMATGVQPFYHENVPTMIKMIQKGSYTIPDGIDDEMRDLIKGILNIDPSKRFSLNEIIQHPLCQKYSQYFAHNNISNV